MSNASTSYICTSSNADTVGGSCSCHCQETRSGGCQHPGHRTRRGSAAEAERERAEGVDAAAVPRAGAASAAITTTAAMPARSEARSRIHPVCACRAQPTTERFGPDGSDDGSGALTWAREIDPRAFPSWERNSSAPFVSITAAFCEPVLDDRLEDVEDPR